jgi:WD40 repeat protein/serine/threonine protein kinase
MPTNVKPTLFDQLRASGLLEPATLEELGRLPEAANPDPRALGRLLLQRGLLTRFQINLVAQGRGKDLLVGPYVVLDRLGEGGMGQVYKAQHRHMHRVVALKLIRRERLRSPEAVKRFYQEVQAAAQLHHANIVLAYDANQVGNTHYLAMEYVEGQDLAQLVRDNGPLPVAQACDYIRQAAVGLQHAFERGMVHRDVKPHNLLVTAVPGGKAPAAGPGSWGLVKVLDMGLARLQGPAGQDLALTATGTVIGTPDYLAPEQALDSRAADIRSDLYSLGCTFYFLLTAVAPFQAESLTQLLLKHQMEEPVPVEQRRPDVPEEVQEIIRALIAKRPEDRFQTPAELAAALEPYCTGGGTAAPRPPASRRAAPADDNAWASLLDEDRPPPRAAAREATGIGEGTVTRRRPANREEARTNKALLVAVIGAGVLVPLLAAAALGAFLLHRYARPQPTPTSPVAEVPPPAETSSSVPPAPPVVETGRAPQPPAPGPPPPHLTGSNVPVSVEEARRLPVHDPVSAQVTFGAIGNRALITANQWAYLFDVNTGQQLQRIGPHPGSFSAGRIAPDGRRAFLSCLDKIVYQWDLETGALTPRFTGHRAWVNCIAVSPDGRRVLSGSGSPRFEDGKPVQRDGKQVYDDCGVRVWDADTGKEVCRFTGHTGPVYEVEVFPDGRRAVSRGLDGLILWDTESGREIGRLGNATRARAGVRNLVLFPDGRQALLALANGDVVIWDVDGDREAFRLTEGIRHSSALALSADGRRAVTTSDHLESRNGQAEWSDCVIHLWELPGGRELRRFEGHTAMISSVALSPDGSRLVSAGWDRTVRVWATEESFPVTVRRPPPPGPRPAANPPVVKKEPVPEEADQMEAERLLKKEYKEDYAKKPAERGELAANLLGKAKATNDDPAGRYVLLREARGLAAAAGDAATAITAIDQMARLYEVDDTAAMKVTALTTASKVVTKPEPAKALAESALVVLEELVAGDYYKKAEQVAALAEAAARKAGQAAFTKRVEAQVKEVKAAEKDHEAAEVARAVLRRQSDDPEANLTVGKYLCFRKGDWDAGLPLLARSGDKALREAAEADLARPGAADEQKKVGDRWWDLAEQKPVLGKTHLQRRAAYWYQQAVTGLSGLTLDKVQDRIKTVVEQTPDLKPAESRGELRTFTGHSARVTCVAFFPDGKQLVSGSYDGTLRLWDVQTGKEAKVLKMFGDPEVTSVATDGGYIAAGKLGGQAVLWQAEPWRQITSFSVGPTNPVQCVAFAGTDHRVVFGTANGNAWLWPRAGAASDVSAGRRWLGVNGVGVSSKGNFALFACSDGLAHLVDLEIRKERGVFAGHLGPVLSAALAPSGNYAATGGTDKTARYWSVRDGREVRRFRGHGGKVLSVAISPDGKYVATGSEDRTVRLWDPGTGREIRRFTGHEGAVNGVAFSPDGRQLVSCSDDKTVRLWELSRAPGP